MLLFGPYQKHQKLKKVFEAPDRPCQVALVAATVTPGLARNRLPRHSHLRSPPLHSFQ